ncbi:hypothetical protein O1611_g4066 [Lasiodiplodia mahajangana]|uniref:Uncharacterized protein n=1 Tax=Lasiodiplodia mahajangana TaxID=1108764 RepID=A0ACC2JQ57_9PEZI|nr:hypothetical protein O1611_g4066 [Lasiodiplodia mahajangana]
MGPPGRPFQNGIPLTLVSVGMVGNDAVEALFAEKTLGDEVLAKEVQGRSGMFDTEKGKKKKKAIPQTFYQHAVAA